MELFFSVKQQKMNVLLCIVLIFCCSFTSVAAYTGTTLAGDFPVRGFHIDLRIQVMKIPALKELALTLSKAGMNTLIMEYEGTFPFEKHPLIANRYAYTKAEIVDFVAYCNQLGIDVVPLQQSFGHLEYILRNNRYKDLREDQKDFSQVCPAKEDLNIALFTDLYKELIATHTSKYIHIGGDETHLLGHDSLCAKLVEANGMSDLYGKHIKLLCDIVIKLGKIPVLWADIALKYPDATKFLPKEAILVDWNYGWEMDKFGDHSKLMKSGFEIWGATALRSSPDNYNFTTWEKHFDNIRDFIPAARRLQYKGMIMTSWSTSGVYAPVYESAYDLVDLYPVRRVYPFTGFNMLLAAFVTGIKTDAPLKIDAFILGYAKDTYGFNKRQATSFWKALKAGPYEVGDGTVKGPISLMQLLDSTVLSAQILDSLVPLKNKEEFEQYQMMTAIRVQYLSFQLLEKQVNEPSFVAVNIPPILKKLQVVLEQTRQLNQKYVLLNEKSFYPSELEKDNELRVARMQLLHDRLAKVR